MRKTVIIFLFLGIAGCSTTQGFSRSFEYPQSFTRVPMADDTYRVFELPSEQTIMTTSSLGKAARAGAARGATFGLAQTNTPEQLHQAAARQYLLQTGRADCVITSGRLLMQPQYEFTYRCPQVTPEAPSDAR